VFQAGPLLITWHGLFTALGLLVGIWLAVRLATCAGIAEDDVTVVALWGTLGAIIGARLFHVADHWEYYSQNPSQIPLVNEGGIAIYGAIVGGLTVGAVVAWRRHLNVARMADIAAAPFILGMAIGRIGDIINGEHRGVSAVGFPLAVTYTNPHTLGQLGVPVHLAVGYELLLDLAIFGGLLWLGRAVARDGACWTWRWHPRVQQDGVIFWTYLALYSAGRVVIEFYREDVPFAFGLSESQLFGIVGTLVGIVALVFLLARPASGPLGTSPRRAAHSS
jgi:phosphatidylglycerol:prolipoprotein diacylglycerol transferase